MLSHDNVSCVILIHASRILFKIYPDYVELQAFC